MSTATNAILKAKIENQVSEVLLKTTAANVYVDDDTTLAAQLSNIIADIATKASITQLNEGLATKAAESHTHDQSDIIGLTETLAELATNRELTAAIDNLREEMLGDTPVEAYNTFTELAEYIAEHQEVSDALTAAIGTKADKATTLAGYGITDAYKKTEIDSKISTVQSALNSYKAENDARVDNLEVESHDHNNKSVLDGISASNISAWNAKSDSNIFYSATEPANWTTNDLWVQLV